jgi:hypothetical protein
MKINWSKDFQFQHLGCAVSTFRVFTFSIASVNIQYSTVQSEQLQHFRFSIAEKIKNVC